MQAFKKTENIPDIEVPSDSENHIEGAAFEALIAS